MHLEQKITVRCKNLSYDLCDKTHPCLLMETYTRSSGSQWSYYPVNQKGRERKWILTSTKILHFQRWCYISYCIKQEWVRWRKIFTFYLYIKQKPRITSSGLKKNECIHLYWKKIEKKEKKKRTLLSMFKRMTWRLTDSA